MDVGIRVEGARQLRSALKRAGADVADLKAAHASAASLVATRAAATAPRRSGLLAASVRSSGTTSAAIIRAGKARVPYAAPIHWGWSRRGIRPQPFVSRAATSTESSWTETYRAAVLDVVEAVSGA